MEEEVFSVGDAPRLYNNDDLWQLHLELRESSAWQNNGNIGIKL
jgi:outer membrane biogenesis lipoprotein LolB